MEDPIITPAVTISPGALSSAEILSQPHCWEECLDGLDQSQELQQVCNTFPRDLPWLFIGCGSSYYVALAAAASWKHIAGGRAHAIPASELLLFPELVLQHGEPCVAVLISRSGRTSEVLSAAEILTSKHQCRTLAITCTQDQALERMTSSTLRMLPATEQSTVMTRSFTSMLLGLQYLAACVSQKKETKQMIRSLPGLSARRLQNATEQIPAFVQEHTFEDYIFLGQGPFYGIASECVLKVTEMSCSYAQAFHTMEFRHGPKSIVGPHTLVSCLLSESGYDAERKVLEEMKSLGATTLALTNRSDDPTRAASDLLLTLDVPVPEYIWLALAAFPGQLLGLHTALKKGLNPDQPRNLTHVVVLED